ncbi:hypothetical protein [Bradyrhizobium sp.]|uniref:hypothetical protein n=1 Tax=Bradyrhizobium sp. TaxID=376 RepID=UPI0039E30003
MATALTGGLSTKADAGTGTVRLSVFKAGFIIGGGGGKGVLNYAGHSYPFDVGGIGLGTIGIAEAKYNGVVYNLRSPSDIEGAYQAAGAGIAIVGGVKVARLQNARGVVLELRGVQAGFEASLGLGGITINLR